MKVSNNTKKLLQRARQSKEGWKSRDLLDLYAGFGFTIRDARGSEKYVRHPKHNDLHAMVTNHPKALHPKYVSLAVKFIDRLLELEGEENDE